MHEKNTNETFEAVHLEIMVQDVCLVNLNLDISIITK